MLFSAITSSPDIPKIEKHSALVLAPHGYIVEQLTYIDPIDQAIKEASDSQDAPETLLYDLIDAIKYAKDDNKITVLVISTKGLWGAGVTKLQDLTAAIKDFKESGKKVIVYDDNYSQAQFYLASVADEVYMNTDGGVFLLGMARYRTYYKSFLDKFDVTVNVFKVGKYKSAIEPFIRDDMSEAAREANLLWLGELWDDFKQDLSDNLQIENSKINEYIDNFKDNLISYKGDSAKLAVDYGLVDKLMSRIEFREYMMDLVGADEDNKSFKQINHANYLRVKKSNYDYLDPYSNKVAVVTAKGNILDGEHKEGNIGGDTVSRLIRRARLDETVGAIVLRVDSGGGSAFASEVIRKELVKAQEDGIKVVVSMGDVAASGGYWISATADEIWAKPSTITGSIGIFGMIPTFDKLMNKYGIHRDGVGTTPYANPVDVGMPISADVAEIIQTEIDSGYQKFLELVAKGRNMTTEQVNEIAQGRVWSGSQGHKLGLVDNLGSLNDAIKSAAALAEFEEDKYDIWNVKRELSEKELFLRDLLNTSEVTETLKSSADRKPSLADKALNDVTQSLKTLNMWNDPNHIYSNCLCEVTY